MFETISAIIVTVSNMKASTAFYRDTLGISIKFESPDWTEFITEGTTLALHSTTDQRKAQPGGVSFGFRVNNIDEVYDLLQARGVQFVMPPTKQDFGAKLAVFLDPDGHSISMSDYQA